MVAEKGPLVKAETWGAGKWEGEEDWVPPPRPKLRRHLSIRDSIRVPRRVAIGIAVMFVAWAVLVTILLVHMYSQRGKVRRPRAPAPRRAELMR